ncbi:MAG: CoA transferase [Dehalococcoidia bacterium]|nr:CoA transferase [Dehalococcoidia bacterium]
MSTEEEKALPSNIAAAPLAGLKVLDFATVVLGPTTTRHLADYGATVLKIESAVHPDTIRVSIPYAGGQPGIDRSVYFAPYNSGKMSIALNLNLPKAREIANRLVAWADLVVESFTPRVMRGWGLGYEDLRKIRPDLIMASTCLQGQNGPHSSLRGYGQSPSGLVGWYELTGWPDGLPVGPYSAYSDFIDWNYLLASILAALDYRRRTGLGQYIDQSQYESALQFAAPALLDYAVNGRLASRMGNRDHRAVPHGCYPCQGDDRWCVIAVFTEEEWQNLCMVMGHLDFLHDPRFATYQARMAHQNELDCLISEWTSLFPARAVMETMQSVGIAAGAVAKAEDLFRDPQLQHRNHFVKLEHSEIGSYSCMTSSFKLSATPGFPAGPSPCLGEHTEYICREILHLDDDELADLIAEEVFT